MGRMQRRKGASFECAMANALKPVYPEARRGIGQVRTAGEVADVEKTPWWIECKHHKVVNIRAAMKQAAESTDGRPCVVISRCNDEPVLVTMRFDDWLALVEAYLRYARNAAEVEGPSPCETNATSSE